jgi:hypothetical protein
MKSFIRILLISALVVCTFSITLMAQPTPIPGGSTGNQPPIGGPTGAPIGDSMMPLVLIGIAYGMIQVYRIYRRKIVTRDA